MSEQLWTTLFLLFLWKYQIFIYKETFHYIHRNWVSQAQIFANFIFAMKVLKTIKFRVFGGKIVKINSARIRSKKNISREKSLTLIREKKKVWSILGYNLIIITFMKAITLNNSHVFLIYQTKYRRRFFHHLVIWRSICLEIFHI